MKKGIHPKLRPVIFCDSGTDAMFLALSTVPTKKTGKYKGTEYPLIDIEISSSSHPFYTGTQQLVDTAGRIDRFNKRYNIESSPESKEKKSE